MDLSFTQIAAICNVSERTVQRWIREKRLNAQPLPNGRYRLSESDLQAVMPPDTSTMQERIEALENELRRLHETLQSLNARIEVLEQERMRVDLKQSFKPNTPQTRVLRPAPPEYHVAPGDQVTARHFAESHQVGRDRMDTLCKSGAIETTQVPSQGKTQHRLNPDQQRAVLRYWQEHHILFEQCSVEGCPCHEQT